MQTSIRLAVAATYPIVTDLQSADAPINYAKSLTLADGVGNSQADRMFTDTRTLAPSANEDLDLAGVLFDVFGRAFTVVKLKCFLIVAAIGNAAANKVQVRRGATNGVPIFTAVSSGVADLEAGGMFLWASPLAGVTVTPATGDLVNIANSAGTNSVNYDVVIIGTSA